jgi:hypothetical protein
VVAGTMLVIFIVLAVAIYVGVFVILSPMMGWPRLRNACGTHHRCRADTHLMRRIIAGRFLNTILNSSQRRDLHLLP